MGNPSFDDPAWLTKEAQWRQALARGDQSAFDEIFRAYAGPLYQRILLPRLGDAASAEDALLETFRKVWNSLESDSYQDQGKTLWPYLATIASNQAHDCLRARAREGRAQTSFAALLAPLLEGTAASSDGAQELTELRAAIDQVLQRLQAHNPRYRRAIEARFLEERGREDCAALLGVKLGTFDVLLLRALRAFRAQWQEHHETLSRES